MSRIQITGRRARKSGKGSGFYGGYRVIEYHPNFGGRTEHGKFRTKKIAEGFAKKLKKKR